MASRQLRPRHTPAQSESHAEASAPITTIEPEESGGGSGEPQAPFTETLEALRRRVQQLEEEEALLRRAADVYEARFGTDWDQYPTDIRAYVQRRADVRSRGKRYRRDPSNAVVEDFLAGLQSTDSDAPALAMSVSSAAESLMTRQSDPRPRIAMKPKLYKGKSAHELAEYIRTCRRYFEYDPEGYRHQRTQVTWAVLWLDDEPAQHWDRYLKNGGTPDISFEEYHQFLHNLLQDPANRRREAMLRYETARQRPGQPIRAFVNYLEELEEELDPFNERQKADSLFVKMAPTMRQRLIENGFATQEHTRAELANTVAMLEQNSSGPRQPPAPQPDFRERRSGSRPHKPWKNRDPKRESTAPKPPSHTSVDAGARNPARDWKREATCFNCQKKGHISKECRAPKTSQPRRD